MKLLLLLRNMDKDVPPIIFLDETVTFNPAELFHNAIFCWALQCHLQPDQKKSLWRDI